METSTIKGCCLEKVEYAGWPEVADTGRAASYPTFASASQLDVGLIEITTWSIDEGKKGRNKPYCT